MTAVSEMCRSGQHHLATVGVDHRGGCKGCADGSRYEREETKVGRMRRLLREAKTPRPGWQVDAKCGGQDPAMWMPVDGQQGQTADVIASRNRVRHDAAKRVCGLCPVREDCLDWVLQGFLHGGVKQYGTWGAEFFAEADWTAAAQARKEMNRE